MREGRPSETASMVAFLRALADGGATTAVGFSDPYAAAMLPARWRRALPWVEGAIRWVPGARRVAVRLDPIPLRMMVGDTAIATAIAAGARRLVILGAGLDTRAHRLAGLGEVDVLEVDHPATQAWKRRVAAGLPVLSRSLAYVPVDFERETLGAGLAAYPPALTVWVWEGVIMYLTDAALRASLADIARGSAAGSTLIAHYHEPGRRDVSGVAAYTRLVGEPMVGPRTRAQMHSFLAEAGFDVVEDIATPVWAERAGAAPPVGDVGRVGRIVVGRVRAALTGTRCFE